MHIKYPATEHVVRDVERILADIGNVETASVTRILSFKDATILISVSKNSDKNAVFMLEQTMDSIADAYKVSPSADSPIGLEGFSALKVDANINSINE